MRRKIKVVNPRAQFPPIKYTPMANRLDSIDGKVIYIVDVRWPYTHEFAEELCKVLSEKWERTSFVVRKKAGSYMEDDPRLWAEIQERGHGAIITVGH